MPGPRSLRRAVLVAIALAGATAGARTAPPPAAEAHKLMLKSFEEGKVDRSLLGDEFSWYLTDEKLRAASLRLKPYGKPAKVDLESTSERGGMEVSRVRFTFAHDILRGQMYRSPDGKIQQFFVSKD